MRPDSAAKDGPLSPVSALISGAATTLLAFCRICSQARFTQVRGSPFGMLCQAQSS